MALGQGGTIPRDLDKAEQLLKKKMSDLMLKGPFGKPVVGALVIDGTTFHHLHAVGVSFDSAYLDAPLFLGLIYAEPDEDEEDGFTYDHVRCTDDLLAMMQSYGIGVDPKEPEAPMVKEKVLAALRLMLTCIMGDNVLYNAAVVRLLGVALGKCIPHALALTVKKPLELLPGFKHMVVDGSTIIWSGGTNKRAAALRALGLEPLKLRVLTTRFCSTIGPALYRLEHWAVCKTFYTTSELLPLEDAGAGGGLEADVRSVHGRYAQKAAAANKEPSAPVVLAMSSVMYESVPDIVKAMSTDGDHTPKDAVQKLDDVNDHLVACESDTAGVVEQAVHMALGDNVGAKLMAEHKKRFGPVIASMAAMSRASFDKHIQPMMPYLKMRQTYNPNVLAPVPTMEALKKEDVGATFASFGPKVKALFIAYKKEVATLYTADQLMPPVPSTEEWNALRPAERDAAIKGRYASPSKYWLSKASEWPELAQIALWHLSFPTSSICIERVFARMRMIAVPQRLSAAPETFARELLFRVNLQLVDAMLAEARRAI